MGYGVALGVLLLVVALAGASRAGTPARIKLPARVLLAGDSHAQGLEPHLKTALRARGVALDTSFIVGSSSRDWRREHFARALEQSPAELVLLVLGTNDCASSTLAPEFFGNVQTLADRFDRRTLILLQPPGACARIRSALEQVRRAEVFYPPEMPMNGVHATPAGYARWSSAILGRFEP